ncbi:MAG: aminoglycoside phosphotransferase family protein [Pseudomonadota bacterium]
MTDPRLRAARPFLAAQGWGDAAITQIAGDASFRRYFRLMRGKQRAVLMDAPPEREEVRPFIAIARALIARGLSAPTILAADAGRGFLLLEDLGDRLYAPSFAAGLDEACAYQAATDVLVHLHGAPPPATLAGLDGPYALPLYDAARLEREVALFLDWLWPCIAGAAAPATMRGDFLARWRRLWPLLGDADCWVLLDYHSPNLMWLDERAGLARVGILDFQDAMRGHPAYDLVSLLQDPRRDLGPGLEAAMRARYLKARPALDEAAFAAAYALLGAQRATRILGVFTRLWRRDAKPGYLRHMPRLWRSLEADLQHPALAPLAAWFDTHVPPSLRAAPLPGAPA